MPYQVIMNAEGCDGHAVVKVDSTIPIDGGCHATHKEAIDHMTALNMATADENTYRHEDVASAIDEAINLLTEAKKSYESNENDQPTNEMRVDGADCVLIVDIDGTLLENGVKPIQKVIDYVNYDYPECVVAIVTGRLEADREATIAALSAVGVKYDQLIMKQDDKIDTAEYKKGVAEGFIADGKSIDKAIDNDSAARDAYKELGIDAVSPNELDMSEEIGEEMQENSLRSSKSEAKRTMDYAYGIVKRLDAVESNSTNKYDWQIMTDTMQWVATDINEKRSIAYSNLELRAESDGNTIVGYAAIWDSPSEPMPFTEYVKRGAFSKTLNDGADVRLLVDHEGVPLARTKSGTMTLVEDQRGLRMEAKLDPMNPDAARIMSAMKRGDLSQMSFAFRTVKDNWNSDRSVRELREVQLFDVSVVTFPAYEETVAELRSVLTSVIIAPTTGVRLRKSQIELQKYRSR